MVKGYDLREREGEGRISELTVLPDEGTANGEAIQSGMQTSTRLKKVIQPLRVEIGQGCVLTRD